MLCLDVSIPFNVVENEGFKKFVAQMINFGSTRGKKLGDISELPGRKSVANSAMKIAEKRINEASKLIENGLKINSGAIVLDHGRREYDYLTILAHFFEGWDLHVIPIGFFRCSEDKTSTQVRFKKIILITNVSLSKIYLAVFLNLQIWMDMIEAVPNFKIDEYDLMQFVGVSDEGSNVMKCVRENMPEGKF